MRHRRIMARVAGVLLLATLSLMLAIGAIPSPDAASAGAQPTQPPGVEQRPETLVLRIYFGSRAERDAILEEYGAEEAPTTGGYLTLWADRATYNSIVARGYRVEIDQAATKQANSIVWQPGNGETFFGGYRTVEEMEQFLDQKVAAYPTLAQKVDIGDSWCKTHPGVCTQPAPGFNGYDLWVLRITNRNIPGNKPVFWFDAGIHSREIATSELAMNYIAHLLDGYSSDPDARYLVDYHETWVMPMLNPDGHHIVEAGGGGSAPYLHRKNADRDDGCSVWPPSGSNQFGVDLNRNFTFLWNSCTGCSSGSPCAQTYRGPSAGSEEETQAVMAKIRELIPDQRGPNITDAAPITTTGMYQNMHSYVPVNLYPWAHDASEPAPNYADLRNMGAHMSAGNASPPGNTYPYCDDCLYPVDGDATNFVYGELGAPAMCTEISGGTFLPPFNQVEGIWNENRGMLLYMAKIARMPYLMARGPDAVSVAATPMTVTQGNPAQLAGTINYNWNGNTYIQNVAAAEYYIDAPPWHGGTPLQLQAADGAFDSPTEAVQATVSTGSLAVGRHLLIVRGRGVNDYEGHLSWGPITAAFLDVLPVGGTPTSTPTAPVLTNTPTNTATGSPISFTPTNTPVAASTTPTPCAIAFSDVFPSDYFYEAVRYLACAGVISGYSDGTFRPYNNTTRGQLTKIVVLGFGLTIYTPPSPTFTDVPTTDPFYQYIETAAYEELVSGYSDGTFRPYNNVTRGQLSKIVVVAAGWPLLNPPTPTFTDVPTTHTFYQYIETAYSHAIISGYSDGTFRPGNDATRGQIAKIVHNAIPRTAR